MNRMSKDPTASKRPPLSVLSQLTLMTNERTHESAKLICQTASPKKKKYILSY